MIRKIIFVLLFAFCLKAQAQNTFTVRAPGELFSDRPKSDSIQKTPFKINGKMLLWDSVGVTINTHYPNFDTIYYFEEEIISRFQPNEKYMIVQACCMSYDLLPESKAIPFNKGNSNSDFDEAVFDSLRALYYDDHTAIKFSHKHQKYFKNLGAYFPDHAAMPFLILLEHSPKDYWYGAPKGWFRNNISTLAFVDITDSLKMDFAKHDSDERKEIVEDVYLFGDKFHSAFSYRFFHGEKLEIEYDPRKKKITKISIIE